MITNPNSFCPCGSGKRFKKCCAPLQWRGDFDNIVINKAVAYAGGIGNRRKTFCQAYTQNKENEIDCLVGQITEEIHAKQETISCSKGCSHCCKLYVFATLQEAEAIVYYLYHNQDALSYFLLRYIAWEEAIEPIGSNIERLENIEEKVLFGTETDEERQTFYADLSTYADVQAPCPFLRDNTCVIYPVRPYSCACLLSTSPQSWCDRTNPERQKTTFYRKHPNRLLEMSYMGLSSGIMFGCLPQMVYRTLSEGYSFLSSFPGLENLKCEASTDQEIRATLKKLKVI